MTFDQWCKDYGPEDDAQIEVARRAWDAAIASVDTDAPSKEYVVKDYDDQSRSSVHAYYGSAYVFNSDDWADSTMQLSPSDTAQGEPK